MAAAFEELQPDVVFNCAAFHNVEVCEREEDRALEVNVRAVQAAGRALRRDGAKLVHLSTNYVFDGDRERAVRARTTCRARASIYALTKLAGEHAALAYAPDALVVRGAGLYGLHGSASQGRQLRRRA